ncbi:hypothetical protein [Methylomonas sp. DH-1]|uniref:hypothetical protein n=1 Tax=Methylomonas sp. (strain DH-1) TaxID=1727196 RepID=UPI0012F65B43|nr:hypothetical protein [Methylomonas sp. DH-1]
MATQGSVNNRIKRRKFTRYRFAASNYALVRVSVPFFEPQQCVTGSGREGSGYPEILLDLSGMSGKIFLQNRIFAKNTRFSALIPAAASRLVKNSQSCSHQGA